MNCLEFRRLRLAEPDAPNKEADAHVSARRVGASRTTFTIWTDS